MTEVVPSPEGAATPAAPQDALGRFLLGWSQLSALCGVALLLGICLLSTWSVLGRALFDSPVMATWKSCKSFARWPLPLSCPTRR